MSDGFVISAAAFSRDGRYRYTLERVWDPAGSVCVFVMLNPSVADDKVTDPTVRRCVGFARRWGYGGLRVLNLFALRSTDPKALYADPAPVGVENDDHLLALTRPDRAGLVVCGWGAHGALHGRAWHVADMLRKAGVKLHRLGATAGGEPRHPLYVKGDTEPEPIP